MKKRLKNKHIKTFRRARYYDFEYYFETMELVNFASEIYLSPFYEYKIYYLSDIKHDINSALESLLKRN